MAKPQEGPVSRVPAVRASVTELVILALALAFAVNLLTSVFFASVPRWTALLVGIIMSVVSIGFVIRARLRPEVYTRSIPGFFVYHRKTHDLIAVPEYELAEDAVRFLSAAFAENPALRRQWDAQPLIGANMPRGDKRGLAHQLLFELMEYIILFRLSMALEDHFNSTEFAPDKLRTYQRTDIPDILLKNRLLELLSRDIADRPSFKDDFDDPDHENWMVFSTSGQGGAIYNRFELTLPADSAITRAADGALIIEGPSVSLRIATIYAGFHASVPFDLANLYLQKPGFDWDPLAVDFNLTISVKRPLFMRGDAIRYSMWVEKVLADLTTSLSGEEFIARIQWPLLESAVRIFKPRRLYAPDTTAGQSENPDDGSALTDEG